MHRNLARLDPLTGLVDSFAPNPNGTVSRVALQADGKILVAGGFHSNNGEISIGGQARNYFARLDPVSGLADSLDLNPNLTSPGANNGPITSIAVQADNKILLSGFFTSIGGEPRNHMARFNASSGLVDSFDPNLINNDLPDGPVSNGIALQADDKILVGGSFINIGGQPRSYIARLDPDTGEADPYNPDATRAFFFVLPAPDGKILAGYALGQVVGGQARTSFARLTNDTAALQSLIITEHTISWIRGGSSPLLHRATFEYSLDNVNYVLLGDGTASGSNWTMSGLNFPGGQNFYIRARGYYSTDISQSISESTRNVFLFGPTRVVSRKSHRSAGAFDIDLPLTGDAGVECRSGGANGDYQLVFTFLSEVTFDNAVISDGAGSVSGTTGSGTNTITVNLTGVTNAQTINIDLLGASDGTNTSNFVVPMSVLVGDTSGNGVVNASDLTETKGQVGVPLNDHNFREDVNANGSINASDVSLVKSKSGTALP
jgi:hypothetical protein